MNHKEFKIMNSNYVTNFRNYLTLKRINYKKNPCKYDYSDEMKQIFEDDKLYEMLQMFGESVIEFGEDSINLYSNEVEYDPAIYDIMEMFIDFFIPLYNTNLEFAKAFGGVSKNVKPIILQKIKDS